jgi:hypothetical protein
MTTRETAPKHHAARDRGTVLSTIWIFLVLSFIYADVFTLFFDKSVSTQTTELSSGAVLFFAVVMETAIAMVLLCRVLPCSWNRWTNVGVAVLHVAVLGYSLTGGTVTAFYAFFAAIEMATLLFVVGYAWTWRKQPQLDRVALVAGA